ncbi:MAG: hypothetical protein IJU50_04845 [Lachnospiraceae bacterium]|nr:hypothetical protein [Lachnospiraceae bacterium]
MRKKEILRTVILLFSFSLVLMACGGENRRGIAGESSLGSSSEDSLESADQESDEEERIEPPDETNEDAENTGLADSEVDAGESEEKAGGIDIGDIPFGAGAPIYLSKDEMLQFLEGEWELHKGGEKIMPYDEEPDTLTFSSKMGLAAFKRGSTGASAGFVYEVSDLYDEAQEEQNLLTLLGVDIHYDYSERFEELIGSEAQFQIFLANDLGVDTLILREVSKEVDWLTDNPGISPVFSEEVLTWEDSDLGFYIYTRKGESVLSSSLGQEDLLRLSDADFTAFKFSDYGDSCTLIPVELSLSEEDPDVFAIRPLDKGLGLSTVLYPYAEGGEEAHSGKYDPVLIGVKTNGNSEITDTIVFAYEGNGYYSNRHFSIEDLDDNGEMEYELENIP